MYQSFKSLGLDDLDGLIGRGDETVKPPAWLSRIDVDALDSREADALESLVRAGDYTPSRLARWRRVAREQGIDAEDQ